MKTNTCIRVLADPVQIADCKSSLEGLEWPIGTISRALGLAGNEVRLKMMYLLLREEEMCPCDLSDALGMTVPAISQHLRKLRDGGLVFDRKVGQTIFYSLNEDETQIIRPLLDELLMLDKKEIKKR